VGLAVAVDQLPDSRAVGEINMLHVENNFREALPKEGIDRLGQASSAAPCRQPAVQI
jgi:hypothetical protein